MCLLGGVVDEGDYDLEVSKTRTITTLSVIVWKKRANKSLGTEFSLADKQ